MIRNTKVYSGFTIFFWSTLVIELILLEFLQSIPILVIIATVISSLGTIVLLFVFIRSYFKARGRVQKLKDEYLESLKPKHPLRFCASDEELMKAYKESALEIQKEAMKKSQEQTNKQNQNNDEQEKSNNEEMVM